MVGESGVQGRLYSSEDEGELLGDGTDEPRIDRVMGVIEEEVSCGYAISQLMPGRLVGTRAGLKRYLEVFGGRVVEAGKGREFDMTSARARRGAQGLTPGGILAAAGGNSRRRRRELGLPGDQRTIRGGAGHGLFAAFIIHSVTSRMTKLPGASFVSTSCRAWLQIAFPPPSRPASANHRFSVLFRVVPITSTRLPA